MKRTFSDMVTKTVKMINRKLKTRQMETSNIKEKINQIIGSIIEPERAELMAKEIIINFNSHIVKTLRENKEADLVEILEKLWIKI